MIMNSHRYRIALEVKIKFSHIQQFFEIFQNTAYKTLKYFNIKCSISKISKIHNIKQMLLNL